MWRAAAIYPATTGIIFLGTPHRGANKAAWATLTEALATSVLNSNTEASAHALMRGAEVLERLQDSFCGLLSGVSVYSFFETLPVSGKGKASLLWAELSPAGIQHLLLRRNVRTS